jgi:hypothetical protein
MPSGKQGTLKYVRSGQQTLGCDTWTSAMSMVLTTEQQMVLWTRRRQEVACETDTAEISRRRTTGPERSDRWCNRGKIRRCG